MAKIIETREEVGADEMVFQFKVYRSPKDGKSILGYLEPFGAVVDERTIVWIKTDFGIPVAEAFRTVVSMANERGIPFIRVDDPNGLFPPEERPSL